ncbi:MAG: hypothetical protein NC206_01000 [Bacteroides sp.]|nr:hypothetical protein [Roseburia sp.]MCM1345649.1 hypothetical protein [Bacteroides sp.]MCM1421916.1 hypothetical protein [Bacteroides sp.]
MRKLLFTCATLMASSAMFAQKANVTKAMSAITAATANQKEINYEKVAEAWELIQPAMTDPVSSVMPDTWYIAGRVKCLYMNKMLNDRAAGIEMDMGEFFNNQYDIVTYFSKCDELEHTPNAKGKMPKEKYRTMNQTLATGPRQNLLIAASNLVNSDAKQCVKFLDLYFESFNDSLFHGIDLAAKDTMRNDAKYIYATALKAEAKTATDTTKVMEAYEQSLSSKTYAKNACFELMQIYKNKGQMDMWEKYCNMGVEKFPEETMFPKVLIVEYMNAKKWAEATKLCESLIQNHPEDEWAYYNKALIEFNQEKYEVALEEFLKTTEIKDDYVDAWMAAGKAAWKLAQDNATNKELSKKYYATAIECFEKSRELEPGKPDLWGYSLYACYNNSGNIEKSKEFKQYVK